MMALGYKLFNITTAAITAVGFTVSCATSVFSADYSAALAAMQAGDEKAAFKEWMELANGGDPSAQNIIGDYYHKGKAAPQSYTEAAKWYELSANQGNPAAATKLAGMLYEGKGVEQDFERSESLFKAAVVEDYTPAQIGLGGFYLNGDASSPDYTLAHAWFNIAASNGSKQGRRLMDELALRMSSSDINIAQKIAVRCRASGYTDCNY